MTNVRLYVDAVHECGSGYAANDVETHERYKGLYSLNATRFIVPSA